jgi:hypothetical protein
MSTEGAVSAVKSRIAFKAEFTVKVSLFTQSKNLIDGLLAAALNRQMTKNVVPRSERHPSFSK